jgi:hypothetical protein
MWLQFSINLWQSPQNANMDFFGNVFYCAGAASHSLILALIPYIIVMLIIAIFKNKLATAIVHIALTAFINVFFYIDSFVFAFYKFHINGMVFGLFFGEGGDEIFQFDTSLYIKVFFVITIIFAINILLYKLSDYLYKKTSKAYFLPVFITFILLTLYSNGVYAYSTVAERQTVLKSATHIPYYYPLTATRFMIRMGVVSQSDLIKADFGKQTGFKYPKNEIIKTDSCNKYNIVILGIDSWNYRGLDNETMPNLYNYAQNNMLYTNHLSCSNATRGSIFGMFFGVSSYYWADFEMSGTTPVLLDVMQEEGYQIQTFPSATLTNPNFAKIIFRKVDGLHTDTDGETVYDRDCQLTNDFTKFLDTLDANKPFFAFLFYDLAHAIQYPSHLTKKFTPSWDFADYMQLNNDLDPTPFWNLYRNSLNAIDSLSGIALNALQAHNLDSNTIVIITGDHGQEFNENHKNYWGHGGNITLPQTHIPLIVHYPDGRQGIANYRTTHYDIPTTLLTDILGIQNTPTDYGMGINLNDSTFRDWHIVGSKENYAFLLKDNIIVEKRHNGTLEISDYKLDPIEGFKLNAAELNEAIKKLNMFYDNE